MNLLKKAISFLKNRELLDWLDDDTYLKLIYWQKIGKKLNLKNPTTFNEKLQWLKLHDHNAEYIKLVDKYEVKKIVKEIIGEEYIIPTLGVWENFEDIDFNQLPNQFVLKCTHDSGGIVICKNKSEFDLEYARKKINKSLNRNYYYHGREWPYKNVKPRIIAEQYMEETGEKELKDYKFMTFSGKVKCSFVCSERNTEGLKVDFFDLNWKRMPFTRHYPNSNKYIEKPKNYDLMIKLSEKLAGNIPFVRVDFYEINGKIYFGEMTFYPGSGLEEFSPEEWDKKIGDMIDLSNINKN